MPVKNTSYTAADSIAELPVGVRLEFNCTRWEGERGQGVIDRYGEKVFLAVLEVIVDGSLKW